MKGKIIFVRDFNFKGVKMFNRLYKIIIIEKLRVNVLQRNLQFIKYVIVFNNEGCRGKCFFIIFIFFVKG